MTRTEKCEKLKSKGYTYDPETGKIYNSKNKEMISKNRYKYIKGGNLFSGNLLQHHFAWYMTYGNVDFEMLDHINMDKTDNRISNLRISNAQENQYNSNAKGYYWCNDRNKWVARLIQNGKKILNKRFNTKEEAHNAYVEAKKTITN